MFPSAHSLNALINIKLCFFEYLFTINIWSFNKSEIVASITTPLLLYLGVLSHPYNKQGTISGFLIINLLKLFT